MMKISGQQPDNQNGYNQKMKKKKIILVAIFIAFCIFIITQAASCIHHSYLSSHQHHPDGQERPHQSAIKTPPSLYRLVKKTCKKTLYPSLCLSSLSSSGFPPLLKNNTTTSAFHHFLEISINRAMKNVVKARFNIAGLSKNQDLAYQEKNALNDCLELLDQTVYELEEAVDDLHSFPVSYENFKTLLSAAMTNENTCIDGVSELEPIPGSVNQKRSLHDYLQKKLKPISRMISICLGIVRYMESINKGKIIRKNKDIPKPENPPWIISNHRNLLGKVPRIVTPDITVAKDGSGFYRSIGEAIQNAPQMSKKRYVIKIKRGVYNESVVIGRKNMNIMLIGDGVNSTIITGSKNFADGYSTFTSATLTVIGDRFIARDLTVINTSGPRKHQAVAVKVTSNSAFYRCNFISYQDTLYAHSLRQFYRDCTIQGTVDFIFGNAAAIFQNCRILVEKPLYGQKNMVTAQGRSDPNQNTGISLQNCNITAAQGFSIADRKIYQTFLGRPWRNYSRTVIMNSYLGELVHPLGWFKWDEYSRIETVEYIEFQNYGPGSRLKGRVNWSGFKKNCSDEYMKKFQVEAFLHGADDWLVTTGFPLSLNPSFIRNARKGGRTSRHPRDNNKKDNFAGAYSSTSEPCCLM